MISGLQGELRISRHLRSLLSEEGAQLGVGILRSFLGEVVTTVESPTAHFLGPPAPDLQDVVVLLEESLTAPQGERPCASGSWLWEDTSLGLQQLNLVAYPDLAVFDHPRADTTATL
jgi:hypothetical protein